MSTLIRKGKTSLGVRTENRVAVENLAEGTEVALVNPEKALKEQKDASASPMGMGQ